MTRRFRELRSELDRRLDALPDGEGGASRERVREKLDRQIVADERTPTDAHDTFKKPETW